MLEEELGVLAKPEDDGVNNKRVEVQMEDILFFSGSTRILLYSAKPRFYKKINSLKNSIANRLLKQDHSSFP